MNRLVSLWGSKVYPQKKRMQNPALPEMAVIPVPLSLRVVARVCPRSLSRWVREESHPHSGEGHGGYSTLWLCQNSY